jgi:hypothetical protein
LQEYRGHAKRVAFVIFLPNASIVSAMTSIPPGILALSIEE